MSGDEAGSTAASCGVLSAIGRTVGIAAWLKVVPGIAARLFKARGPRVLGGMARTPRDDATDSARAAARVRVHRASWARGSVCGGREERRGWAALG